MPRNIYCWHEPEHDAIKVGAGENGNGRMDDYAAERGLTPDPDTLRAFNVPMGFDVLLIERHCHELLIKQGMKRFPGNVTELFRLNTTYVEAADMVERMVEHCIDCFKSGSEIDHDKVKHVHEPIYRHSLGPMYASREEWEAACDRAAAERVVVSSSSNRLAISTQFGEVDNYYDALMAQWGRKPTPRL